MRHPKSASIRQLLETLREAGIEFIVVGGAAATMHGSGTTTEDLDIVPNPTPENIDRLLVFLEKLDAHFRADAAARRLKPARSHLEGGGQLLLSTVLGPLDLLMRLHDGRGYDQLVHHSQVFTDDHIDIEVVRLPELIEIKRHAGRDKDKAVLPILALLPETFPSSTIREMGPVWPQTHWISLPRRGWKSSSRPGSAVT